jgi:hypothetical protein
MKMEQSIPKCRHIKFRRRGITQMKERNIQNTMKVWNQEVVKYLPRQIPPPPPSPQERKI